MGEAILYLSKAGTTVLGWELGPGMIEIVRLLGAVTNVNLPSRSLDSSYLTSNSDTVAFKYLSSLPGLTLGKRLTWSKNGMFEVDSLQATIWLYIFPYGVFALLLRQRYGHVVGMSGLSRKPV